MHQLLGRDKDRLVPPAPPIVAAVAGHREFASGPTTCSEKCRPSSSIGIKGTRRFVRVSLNLRSRVLLLLLLLPPLQLHRRLPPVSSSALSPPAAVRPLFSHRHRSYSGAAARSGPHKHKGPTRSNMSSSDAAAGSGVGDGENSGGAHTDTGGGRATRRQRQRLVLVGGGHAHVQVIRALNRASRPRHLSVTLIDTQRDATYSGMVPGCVAGLYDDPERTSIRLCPLAEWAGIDFVHGEVVDVDPVNRRLFVMPNNRGRGENDVDGAEKDDDDEDDDGRDNGSGGGDAGHSSVSPPAAVVVVLPYDAVSFDIGSTTRGLREEWRRYVIPTRPISDLVRRIEVAERDIIVSENDDRDDRDRDGDGRGRAPSVRLVVVGGGAAGIELSLAMRARWGGRPPPPSLPPPEFTVTLLDANDKLVPAETDRCRSALSDALSSRDIEVRHGSVVADVRPCSPSSPSGERERGGGGGGVVELEDGETVPFTHCLWATGAAPHPLSAVTMAERRGIAVDDDRGWIRVRPTLQSVSHPHIFAAGDCASIEGLLGGGGGGGGGDDGDGCRPSPPKAGVYAVRAGPVLIENLTAFLANEKNFRVEEEEGGGGGDEGKKKERRPPGRELIEYDPQDDFLKLIMCGDGTAIGFRFGLALGGRWVWRLKDRIDSTFVDLFDVRYLPPLKDQTEEGDGGREERGDEEEEEETEGKSSYDTSQYDAVSDRPPPLDPAEAGELILRTDDDVDYEAAWDVLRDMKDDEDYRSRVLEIIAHPPLPTS